MSRLASRQRSDTEHSMIDESGKHSVEALASRNFDDSGDPISACSSLSVSIEGVCSELVQTRCFRFPHG
jgi:hypothetical protein